MALNLPRVVQSLVTSSPEADRVRQNIVTAVQPVLDFLGNYLAPAADGSLQILRNVKAAGNVILNGNATINGTTQANGAVTVTGAQTQNGNLTVNGNTAFRNRTDGGVCITPLANTTAFYTTDATNSVVKFAIDDAGTVISRGTVTANNFVSSVGGFKTYVDMGTFWRQTTQGGVLRTVFPVIRTDTNAQATIAVNRQMPFSGSIVGISMANDRSLGGDMTVQVFKNNTSGTTGQIIDTMGIKAGNLYPVSPITFPKGQYPFNAGDYLGVGSYIGTGYVVATSFGLIVEYGA